MSLEENHTLEIKQSLEAKQSLLIKEIINKGFDPQLFQLQFDNDKSLEQWDFQELEAAIKLFQTQQTDYFQVFPCSRSQLSNITSFQIIGYEKVNRGIFQGTSIYFRILTNCGEFRRNYEQFLQLRNSLKNYYLPELPNHNKPNPNDFTYLKQMYFLNHFLNYILKHQELLHTQVVADFFSDREFKPNPQPYTTQSGDYGVRINLQIDDQIRAAETYCLQTQPLQKKTYKLLRGLMKQFTAVSMTMQSLAESYYKLYSERKESIYVILSHLFGEWNKIQQDQVKIINETLFASQRFQYYLINPLKDHIKQRDNESKQYSELKMKLKQKKDRLFQQGDVLRWDLDESYLDQYKLDQIKSNHAIASLAMCKTDSALLEQTKQKFAFINLKLYEEIQYVFGYTCLQENALKMAKMIALSVQQYHILWADTANNLEIK